MNISDILPIMQLILSFGNICIIGYAFIRFMGKPHNDLNTKVINLEYEVKEIKHSLLCGNDRFRTQDTTNEVIIRAIIALIDFEVHYCETEQKPISKSLERAKEDLHEYFARSNK